MDVISIIGYIAASLTTIAQLPQMIKVINTKRTTDISLYMYIIITLGVFLWLIYGLYINDLPLIGANAITLILVTVILIYKIRYK